MTKVFWGGQAFVVSKIYLLKIEKSHCAHLKEKQWSSVQLPIHERLKFHMDVSAGGRESQTCLIVMLKLCTCSLVRPPKASPPSPPFESQWFIYSYLFFYFLANFHVSFSQLCSFYSVNDFRNVRWRFIESKEVQCT